jgi:hypothetical protein
MKTHESKPCLLSTYHLVIVIVLQQLPSCNNYCLVATIVLHMSLFIDLKKYPQVLVNLM